MLILRSDTTLIGGTHPRMDIGDCLVLPTCSFHHTPRMSSLESSLSRQSQYCVKSLLFQSLFKAIKIFLSNR